MEQLTTPVNLASHMQIIGKWLKGLMIDNDDVEKDGMDSSTQPVSSCGAIPAYKETFPKRFRLVETDGAGGAEGAVGSHYDTSTRQAVLEDMLRERQGTDKLQRLLNSVDELETLRRSLTDKDQMIKALQEKVQKMEKLVQSKSSEGEGRDFRLSLIENSNFDGTLMLNIPQVFQHMDTRCYPSLFGGPVSKVNSCTLSQSKCVTGYEDVDHNDRTLDFSYLTVRCYWLLYCVYLLHACLVSSHRNASLPHLCSMKLQSCRSTKLMGKSIQ